MEKLRVALEVLKKYHFWILVALIVLVTFGAWYWATADRAADFAKGKTKYDGLINSTKSISQVPDHPSDDYNKALDLRITGDVANASDTVKKLANVYSASDSLSYNVANAASRLYDDQRTSFKLPPVYPNNAEDQAKFEEDFWKVWNHKIEDIEKPPAEATNHDQYQLHQAYRLQYRDRIKDIFPQLFDMIELRTVVDPNAAVAGGEVRGGRPGPMGGRQGDDPGKQYKGIVDWADAGKLMDYFRNWNDIPSTIDVMVAQENVWVYEALLKVVRNTNDMSPDPKHDPKKYQPPASHKEARIKEIQALEIGPDAAQSWANCENAVFIFSGDTSGGSATTPAAGAGPVAGAAPAATSSPTPQPIAGRSGTAGFQSAGMTGGTANSLLAGRYVDNSGKPLADQTQQPNQEFRMMPINLRVVMEQKAIPRLLEECANSNMRIDVRAVRMLAEKPAAFDPNSTAAPVETTGGAAPPVVGHVMEGRGRPMTGRGMGPRPFVPGNNVTPSDQSSSEEESVDPVVPPVVVEIQGIIYIYNPPTTPNPNATPSSDGTTPPAAGGAPAAAAPAAGVPATPAPATPPAGPAAPATPPAAAGPTNTPANGAR